MSEPVKVIERDHQPDGTFKAGNKANRRGNPTSKRMRLQMAALGELSPEDGKQITRQAADLAKGGDKAMIRLLLPQLIGRAPNDAMVKDIQSLREEQRELRKLLDELVKRSAQ